MDRLAPRLERELGSIQGITVPNAFAFEKQALSRLWKNILEFSRSPFLTGKGEKVRSEGHPQTPGEGQSPSAHPIL